MDDSKVAWIMICTPMVNGVPQGFFSPIFKTVDDHIIVQDSFGQITKVTKIEKVLENVSVEVPFYNYSTRLYQDTLLKFL